LKQESSKLPKPRKSSALEIKFATLWKSIQGQELVEEHRFHPVRKWRIDFANLENKVGIEIEGGVWSGGRHTRGAGYSKDAEKYNEAIFEGWTIFRLVGSQITLDACKRIKGYIEGKAYKTS
jgi:very-short-patch-repair endonuclease